METVRDLGEGDLWRESLERSLARRAISRRSSIERNEPRAAHARVHDHRPVRAPATAPRVTRKQIPRRQRIVGGGATGIVPLLLLAALLAMALDGHPPAISSAAAHADPIPGGPEHTNARQIVRVSGAGGAARHSRCPLVASSTGYLNPLAGATVKPERIDQGVDYAGSGTLTVIGAARVTHVATDGTGWPGAFIEYRLLAGPDTGCYVFYAEGVTPVAGLRVGDMLSPGQVLATIIPDYPTGFEIGWAAGVGTKTYVGAEGRWSAADDQDNVASGPGRNFSALIASLGGPPGKVEG